MFDCPASRSIPAHAGEPYRKDCEDRIEEVYPRPRGGAKPSCETVFCPTGLSPPTRGSLDHMARETLTEGSIPAHAGEPGPRTVLAPSNPVYPRPRGGAPQAARFFCVCMGLSPPTRGSLTPPDPDHRGRRSIPAHAGEPPAGGADAAGPRVYPRPRGGAALTVGTPSQIGGLSPPTRGSLQVSSPPSRGQRSIPAHAGEPMMTDLLDGIAAVYPRPRGGAHDDRLAGWNRCGLSPPTRGSHAKIDEKIDAARSIPAHAGEPEGCCSLLPSVTVYPRPRGGADGRPPRHATGRGLSPPTRGSRARPKQQPKRCGSIPAHAGEPLDVFAFVHQTQGLSPPTRGSRGRSRARRS